MNQVKLLVILVIFSLLVLSGVGYSEAVKKAPIYNPDANIVKEVEAAIKKATAENKHILLMFGANWCPWCHKLHELFGSDLAIKKILAEKYILVMVDIGETKDKPLNRDLEAKCGVKGMGYPSIAVLDKKGDLICAQSSGVLEKDKGHGPKRVLAFLQVESPN